VKNYFVIFILVLGLFSCIKKDAGPVVNDLTEAYLNGAGAFILNEGNFTWGNGSLSFYSYDSAKIYNHVFLKINERPLGDVPNSMKIFGDKAFIVVNNSGKIEVVSKNSIRSVKTITGLESPRNIGFVNSTKAYVSSLYSDSVAIINLNDYSVSGYINIRRSSESIEITGGKAYVSNWLGGREIIVINTSNDRIIDSIEVAVEPESMVLDKNKILWVLCNGGYARENFAEIISINTQTDKVERRFQFPSKSDSPSCLQIDGDGDILYFLEKGVKRMNITSLILPDIPFIMESDHFFYKICINPDNGDIFLTDAVDYTQKGYVLLYENDGTLIATLQADIIPGSLCIK
jgi:hypothetical protein